MNAYLLYLKDRLRSSFWVVPAAMTMLAIVLAAAMLLLDSQPWSQRLFWWMTVGRTGAEGARLVLSTIAGSMITVASLVFSMTLVALTLAAGNIGPRLIDRFMDNPVNQVALGLFVATFVYALIVLRAISEGDEVFIPHVSISLAMLMALVSFGWLIYFIHDLSRSIQVDNVVAKVAGELAASLDSLAERHAGTVAVPVSETPMGSAVCMHEAGYIQVIDVKSLLQLAIDRDLVIRLPHRPGHFILASTTVADITGACADLEDGIRQAFVLGPKRTAAQDSEHGVALIVEIAARALSPGVNDFPTAIACVDHLTTALDRPFRQGMPANGFRDETGRLRLVLNAITIDGLADAALHPLRQVARRNLPVMLRLFDGLILLAEGELCPEAAHAVRRHGHLIHQAALAENYDDVDRQAMDERYAALQARLSRFEPSARR
ncbi:MAG: DUF2254 domain-containing protein [Rhizobiales bacterium]|nr:DUF2254 domain-containing protein [Hyphomicrobiales bacterium]